MTSSEEQLFDHIYARLKSHAGRMTTKQLAMAVDVSERNLRRHGEVAGILDLASDYILTTYGYVVLRSMNPPGVWMTTSAAEIRANLAQWIVFENRIHQIVDHYRRGIAHLERNDFKFKQLSLPLTN